MVARGCRARALRAYTLRQLCELALAPACVFRVALWAKVPQKPTKDSAKPSGAWLFWSPTAYLSLLLGSGFELGSGLVCGCGL